MLIQHLNRRLFVSLLALVLWLTTSAAFGQTPAFTYQGRLIDGGTPANGIYDLQFTLWDSVSGGTPRPQPNPVTVTLPSVNVSSGTFSVMLDFGASAFPGANRFLEISARLSGAVSFTVLTPRQQITATPYAVRSLVASVADDLSSACAGCVQDSNINAVAASKVTGTIPVASLPGGSTSYVQNTTSEQATSNFNVSGNGTAGGTLSGNVVTATRQYNIGGSRVLSVAGISNVFASVGAGPANTGSANSFFGSLAGNANTVGSDNSFFGNLAGRNNTTGGVNSFFGYAAGAANTNGLSNSFFGALAGQNNTSGPNNAFFGYATGSSNTTANRQCILRRLRRSKQHGQQQLILWPLGRPSSNIRPAAAV